MRITGSYVTSTTLGEAVQAFVPHALPPRAPVLAATSYAALNHAAELALARLAGVSGLVPSVDWLLYSAVRKEALLTSQIEGTQATLTDLFDEEAGFVIANIDDVEEVTNYLRAFRLVQDNLRAADGLPISVRLLCEAHRLLLNGVRGSGKQPGARAHPNRESAPSCRHRAGAPTARHGPRSLTTAGRTGFRHAGPGSRAHRCDPGAAAGAWPESCGRGTRSRRRFRPALRTGRGAGPAAGPLRCASR